VEAASAGIKLTTVADGLSEPVAFATMPGMSETLIVERTGTVVTLSSGGTHSVLNLADAVAWEMNEQGLLGFVVHPDFPADSRGFAFYTDATYSVVISSFEWEGDQFSRDTEQTILSVRQPHPFHQGGALIFGPDGNLWIGLGDGGADGDPLGHSQDAASLLGAIVRLDVDHGTPYVIPPSNPYSDGVEGAQEVWATGLRNPWRVSFDSGHVIIADVGQAGFEELNVVPIADSGANFGWPVREGHGCFDAVVCRSAGLTPPSLEIAREGMCALIGGFVYRSDTIPELNGRYIFGDFCAGWVRSIRFMEGSFVGPLVDHSDEIGNIGRISSFGLDSDGEILVATIDGSIFRVSSEKSRPEDMEAG